MKGGISCPREHNRIGVIGRKRGHWTMGYVPLNVVLWVWKESIYSSLSTRESNVSHPVFFSNRYRKWKFF